MMPSLMEWEATKAILQFNNRGRAVCVAKSRAKHSKEAVLDALQLIDVVKLVGCPNYGAILQYGTNQRLIQHNQRIWRVEILGRAEQKPQQGVRSGRNVINMLLRVK